MAKFGDLINSEKPVLIDFSAEWCGPCKMLKPILSEVKNRLGDDVSIIKIDVDKNKEISAQYSIQSVPTMMLFKNGTMLWRQSGVVSAIDLEKVIKQHS